MSLFKTNSKFNKCFKALSLFLIVILISILSSCGAANKGEFMGSGVIDGLQYRIFSTIEINDETYEIYEPVNVALIDNNLDETMQSLQYVYQELGHQDVDVWRINFFYEYKVLTSNTEINDEVVSKLEKQVIPSVKHFEQNLGISFEYYDFEKETLQEFVVDNKNYDSLYLTVVYIPYYIVNISNYETYHIFIPVKTFLAYRSDSDILFDFGEVLKTVSIDSIYHSENISNIEERGNKYV